MLSGDGSFRFLASFSCVMHVVRCKQKEENFFFVTPYRRESDGGGGVVRVQIKKDIFGGQGIALANSVGGRRKCRSSLQIQDLLRLAFLLSSNQKRDSELNV